MENRWLHRFAVLTAACTFCLIWIGGLVTSKGAGMAVPDWPTTYGYNMFLFPISQWTGGIFYEHSHRLVASLVGLLTVILAVWLWLQEERLWLRRWGILAVVLVVGQGILGGMRVAAMKDELGIFHATLAQLFFILVSCIALWTSPRWIRAGAPVAVSGARSVRRGFAMLFVLVLAQLVVGATMRHQHAGLAIPDFPTAYGEAWPSTSPEAVARYNQARGEVHALNPITAGQIHLQMTHRILAVAILAAVTGMFLRGRRKFASGSPVRRLLAVLTGMVWAQALLGAVTIWSNKAADIATAHVALGALTFMTTGLLCVVARRSLCEAASGIVARSVARPRAELEGSVARA